MPEYFAEQDLTRKIPSLANDEVLTNSTPETYAADIDQVIFAGNRMFQEAVFFHKSSSTAIFTDLMANLKTDGLKLLPRLFLEFEGVTYPNGGVPRLYRWFSNDKDKSTRSVYRYCSAGMLNALCFVMASRSILQQNELLAREFKFLGLQN